jgi:hypothetical protein
MSNVILGQVKSIVKEEVPTIMREEVNRMCLKDMTAPKSKCAADVVSQDIAATNASGNP